MPAILFIGGALVILVLNFLSSWFNARQIGKIWYQVRYMDTWSKTLAWSGAALSAIGFTWVIVCVIALIGELFGMLPVEYSELLLEVSYLSIVPDLIFAGLVTWIHGAIVVFYNRNFENIAIAG